MSSLLSELICSVTQRPGTWKTPITLWFLCALPVILQIELLVCHCYKFINKENATPQKRSFSVVAQWVGILQTPTTRSFQSGPPHQSDFWCDYVVYCLFVLAQPSGFGLIFPDWTKCSWIICEVKYSLRLYGCGVFYKFTAHTKK